jgi:hypothetical protein
MPASAGGHSRRSRPETVAEHSLAGAENARTDLAYPNRTDLYLRWLFSTGRVAERRGVSDMNGDREIVGAVR